MDIKANGPFKALVFVTHVYQSIIEHDTNKGLILIATGALLKELQEQGHKDLEEYITPDPPRCGLLLFTGSLVIPEKDEDLSWIGKWRKPTNNELQRIKYGLKLFIDEEDEERNMAEPSLELQL